MKKIQFERHSVPARKDLLHFTEEFAERKVYEGLGENFKPWLDELNIISMLLTRENLVGGTGLEIPPINEPDVEKLGKDVFLYRGKNYRSRGIWTRKTFDAETAEMIGRSEEWTQYRIGTLGKVMINKEFSGIPIDIFLPENFDKLQNKVKKENGLKRPIFKFKINTKEGEQGVYAKGAETTNGIYYESARPSFRLTSLSSVHRSTSREERDITLKLNSNGIKTPTIIGYYDSAVEEFLFMEEVNGEDPRKFLPSKKEDIIVQDAKMLAKTCLTGYRKQGFHDFDDKIFDGKDLYLIDVDECVDLYSGFPGYRELLLNPKDTRKLRDFRRMQRSTFEGTLRDALFEYKESLTPSQEDRRLYTGTFFKMLGWKELSIKEMAKFTSFNEKHMTMDSYMSMMCDTG